MYGKEAGKFDATMLKVFVRVMGVFPPGTIVQLSNGMLGVVMATNPHKPMLPCVLIYAPKVARETPTVIDLALESDISIRKVLRAENLPMDVFNYLRPRTHMCYYFLKLEATQPQLLAPTERKSA
jgi:hypothetical protein